MKKLSLSFVALALALVNGCNCQPPAPLIALFTAAPDTIAAGSPSTLVFTATEGASLSIDNGVGDVTGTTQKVVSPAATTTYTLTATKEDKTETASVTVTVTAAPALITVFTAAPTAISAGSSSTLVFTALAGATLSIDNGVGDVTGRTQATVTPGANTTYTLTATKDGRTATATATVTVGATPPIGFTVTGLTSATAGVSGTATITAVNATGGTITTYRGTVHFTSDDAQAVLPADVTFTAGDSGVKTVDVTFKTAGSRLLIANDTAGSSAQGFGRIDVSPGPAQSLDAVAGSASVAAGDGVAITVTAHDAFGNQATGFTGTATVTTGDPLATVPATVAFGAADQGRKTFGVSFGLAGSWTVTATSGALTATTSSIAVSPGAIAQVQLAGPSSAIPDAPAGFTATVVDRFGNVITGYTGSIHVTHDDPGAAPVPDASFTSGVATFNVSFATAGDRNVNVIPVSGGGQAGSASIHVDPGAVTHYALSALPANASAGDALSLTITALDAHDNTATAYAQLAHVASADSTDQLPADTGFVAGRASVSLAFVRTGSHSVTVSELGGTIAASSTTTNVGASAAVELALAGAGPSGAGVQASISLVVRDRFGNTVTGFAGTVSFTSTDGQATLPGSYTFTPGDNGAHSFDVTLRTAGAQQVTASDAPDGLATVGHFTVSPAAASQCSLTGVAATASAGTQLVPVVTFRDQFNNVATSYAGTVTLTTTAANAVLPPAAVLGPNDAGSHAFQVQILSTGPARIDASDTINTCSANVGVTPGTPKYTVTFAPDANASWAANGTVTVKDVYDNGIPNYAGVLHFTSTDAAGAPPGDITLDGSEGGVAAFSFTFNTAGTQTLTVSSPTPGPQSGTASVRVHGLVYTNPSVSAGRVRLVLNTASSNASTVQIDVVSNTFTARVNNGVYIRGGVFSAGMNLPVAPNSVVPGTPLLIEPSPVVIPTGAAPKAVMASLPTTGPAANILLVALSGKRAGAGSTPSDSGMVVGTLLWSMRLQIAQGATVGTVFDGNNLPGTFRATMRSVTGDDTIPQETFALGKLEVL